MSEPAMNQSASSGVDAMSLSVGENSALTARRRVTSACPASFSVPVRGPCSRAGSLKAGMPGARNVPYQDGFRVKWYAGIP